MQLTTGATEGSFVSVEFGSQGVRPSGSSGSNVEVVIDGDVVDASGATVGQLHAIAVSAMRDIEKLLRDLGIPIRERDVGYAYEHDSTR